MKVRVQVWGAAKALESRGTRQVGAAEKPPPKRGPPDGTADWASNPDQGWTSEGLARKHAGQHGAKMKLSESEYYEQANQLVKCPPKTAEVFVRENGEALIYDPGTNRFAIRTPDGVPAVMFEPKDGVAYWERELARVGAERIK